MSFTEICSLDDLVENSGVCILIDGQQVALFWLKPATGRSEFFAIGNYDPIGGANVLSRGIMGSVGERIVVASPLYKQHFCLRTGQCLQVPELFVPVYKVMLAQQKILIGKQEQITPTFAA
jgi:nitrite reductase (NADH) small subunit